MIPLFLCRALLGFVERSYMYIYIPLVERSCHTSLIKKMIKKRNRAGRNRAGTGREHARIRPDGLPPDYICPHVSPSRFPFEIGALSPRFLSNVFAFFVSSRAARSWDTDFLQEPVSVWGWQTAAPRRLSKHVICMRGGCIRNSRECLSSPLAPSGVEEARRRGMGEDGIGRKGGRRDDTGQGQRGEVVRESNHVDERKDDLRIAPSLHTPDG